MKTKIRDLEELAKDISRFNLENSIRREVKYTAADIPDLERENATDLKRLAGLAADSPEAVRLREATRARTWKITQLKKNKNSVITETRKERVLIPLDQGTPGLKDFIKANWTIREILFFNNFTHGGTYDAGKGWRINYAGYVADTADGQRNLIRVFNELTTAVFFYIGIKARIEYPATPPAILWARFKADEESPLDMTLNALIRSIPSEAMKLPIPSKAKK